MRTDMRTHNINLEQSETRWQSNESIIVDISREYTIASWRKNHLCKEHLLYRIIPLYNLPDDIIKTSNT